MTCTVRHGECRQPGPGIQQGGLFSLQKYHFKAFIYYIVQTMVGEKLGWTKKDGLFKRERDCNHIVRHLEV